MKLKGKELQVWENYVKKMYDLPIGSEKALFYMFRQPRCTAKVAIQVTIISFYLQKLFDQNAEKLKNKKIVFYYGDSDWMDDKGTLDLCRKYKNMTRKVIPKSNHQPHFENDREFVS